MLKVAIEELTEREREYLKHLQSSQEGGVSFAGYCRSAGLNANKWHRVRHGMVRKGLLPAGGSRGAAARTEPSRPKSSSFVPVRLESGVSTEISAGAACRLRHASGWVIECAALPELQWLKELIGGTQP